MLSHWNGAFFGSYQPEGQTYSHMLRLRLELPDEPRDQVISGDLWLQVGERTLYEASFVTTRQLRIDRIGPARPAPRGKGARQPGSRSKRAGVTLPAAAEPFRKFEVVGPPPDRAGHRISGDAVMTANGYGERIRFHLYLPDDRSANGPVFQSRIWNAEPNGARVLPEWHFHLRPAEAVGDGEPPVFRRFSALAVTFDDVDAERRLLWQQIFDGGNRQDSAAAVSASQVGRAREPTVEDILAAAGIRLDVRQMESRKPVALDPRAILDKEDRGWRDDDLLMQMDEALKQPDSAAAKMARPGRPPAPPAFTLFAVSHYAGDPTVAGLMFAAKRKENPRRGAAVFLKFNGAKALDATEQRRKDLWTAVHEIGHVFNLLHSFDADHSEVTPGPARVDSLTFMNYPSLFPIGREAPGDMEWKQAARSLYWGDFAFTFDQAEQRHLRHGALPDVEVGGSIERHMAENGRTAEATESAPVDGLSLTLVLPEQLDFLEPLIGYFRLRNHHNPPVLVHDSIRTANGTLAIEIEHRGRRRLYAHFRNQCELRDDDDNNADNDGKRPALRRLNPDDTYYGEVRPSCGASWQIVAPGHYRLRARYLTPRGRSIVSSWCDVRINRPGPGLERLAQDFFTPEMSMFLAHDGSRCWFERGETGISNVIDTAKTRCQGEKVTDLLSRLEPASLSGTSRFYDFDPRTAWDAALELGDRIEILAWTKATAFQLRFQMTQAIRTLERCRRLEHEADEASRKKYEYFGAMRAQLSALGAPPDALLPLANDMRTWEDN